MPRVNTWSRSSAGVANGDGSRITLRLGDFPAGSTMERLIFGFVILQDVFYGGITAPARAGALVVGAVALPVSAGVPTFDPVSSPTADWLWTGIFPFEAIPMKWASEEEYRSQFSSPKEQLQSESRRHNGSGETMRVYFVTQAMSLIDSGFTTWRCAVYGSVLYSELSP